GTGHPSSVGEGLMSRPPPTRQTARNGRLNFPCAGTFSGSVSASDGADAGHRDVLVPIPEIVTGRGVVVPTERTQRSARPHPILVRVTRHRSGRDSCHGRRLLARLPGTGV